MAARRCRHRAGFESQDCRHRGGGDRGRRVVRRADRPLDAVAVDPRGHRPPRAGQRGHDDQRGSAHARRARRVRRRARDGEAHGHRRRTPPQPGAGDHGRRRRGRAHGSRARAAARQPPRRVRVRAGARDARVRVSRLSLHACVGCVRDGGRALGGTAPSKGSRASLAHSGTVRGRDRSRLHPVVPGSALGQRHRGGERVRRRGGSAHRASWAPAAAARRSGARVRA